MSLDIDALYRRYGPMVMRRCRSMLNDEHLALDAMQDVFVQVIRYESRLNQEAPSSLLYTIATNTCLNILRSKKRKPETSLNQDDDDNMLERIAHTDGPDEQISAGNLLDKLFRRHPSSTRTIAVLHLHDGLTLEETADTVGMSVSGVRKRLRTLKADLKQLKGIAYD